VRQRTLAAGLMIPIISIWGVGC